MPLLQLSTKFDAANKQHITELHSALSNLNFNIAPSAVDTKTLDGSTTSAIKAFQKDQNLQTTGKLNATTISKLNTALFDNFVATNKIRTGRVQKFLAKIQIPVDKVETTKRIMGDSTRQALIQFQKQFQKDNIPQDGKIDSATFTALQNAAIKATFSVRTQIVKLQTTLVWVLKVAKLNITIDPNELKQKVLGPSTQQAIKNIQQKYRLPATGSLDQATLDKIQSIASSKGTRMIPVGKVNAPELSLVKRVVRLNKVSPMVNDTQKALTFLGYKIDQTEFNTQKYGKTTAAAITAFQQANGIEQTGQMDKRTLKLLNAAIIKANPGAAEVLAKYRVRGSVLDELWNRKPNMVVRVYEKLLDDEVQLASKKNHLNGFFDITYAPPLDTATGQIKDKFHLVIKLFEPQDNNPANDKLVTSQVYYNVGRIHWANFNQSTQKYAGTSEFAQNMKILTKALGTVTLTDIRETTDNKQVTHIVKQTGLQVDNIVQLFLSASVANDVPALPALTHEVFHAFIAQGLPPGLPGDLMRALNLNKWGDDTIASLVETASTGIAFCSDDMQQQVIDNALKGNLVSQNVRQNRDAILRSLKDLRVNFALNKPILTGNVSLTDLLSKSSIPPGQFTNVAQVFIANQGFSDNFWKTLNDPASGFAANTVKDFSDTVDIGIITRNHLPVLQFLKDNSGQGKMFNQISDIAKKSTKDFLNLINVNNLPLPQGMTADLYAGILQTRAEALFPSIARVAAIKSSAIPAFKNIQSVETFADKNLDYDIKSDNIDVYLKDSGAAIDADALKQIKAVERISKITPDAITGAALATNNLFSSSQVYFTGKDRLKTLLEANNISESQAASVYEAAKMKYTVIWHRFLQYNNAVNTGTPAAINNPPIDPGDTSNTPTSTEVKQLIATSPDLESLFGSLDYCSCEDCRSIWSPAAYLTDMMRFLKAHNSNRPAGPGGVPPTVLDILLERRSDLKDIKLNCPNTNIPIRYIDGACEILEKKIAPVIEVPPGVDPKDMYQTSSTAEELRAMPQWMQPSAYDLLATVDFPMSSSFNLWQEETRAYLNYLKVPRHELMLAFQDKKDVNDKKPDDATIAAEFFGISFHEKDIIVTKRDNAVDQKKYWGLDVTQNPVPVKAFLQRSGLKYEELLELLLIKFVNDPSANQSVIDRPIDTCDTDVQSITNLTLQKFDLMHRFIRLWRKTGWKMWELDLLLRNPGIAVNNVLDNGALTNLQIFKQLQDKLSLKLEIGLLFFDRINTDDRIKPDDPKVIIRSLYNSMFQNSLVRNPVDARFAVKTATHDVDTTVILGSDSIQTILSALVIRQTDYDLLVNYFSTSGIAFDGHLSLANISMLTRYIYLARSLKLSIKDLLLLFNVSNAPNPFTSLQVTSDFVKNYDIIKSSGYTLNELDYILKLSTDSPVGLRDDSVAEVLESIRKILETIAALGLSRGDQNNILSFDAASLSTLAGQALKNALQPLTTILQSKITNFQASSFSVDQARFIINFDATAATDNQVANLINNIKQLQENLATFVAQTKSQVKSLLCTSLGFTDEQGGFILTNLKFQGSAVSLVDTVSDDKLLNLKNPADPQSPYLEISTANYPDQFSTYRLLHKISLLLKRMPLETDDLEWYLQNTKNLNAILVTTNPKSNTLDFEALLAADTSVNFGGWLTFYKLFNFKSMHPEPEGSTLRGILDLIVNPSGGSPSKNIIIQAIADLTQWSVADLTSLDTNLELTVSDYVNGETYQRLQKCIDQMKRTGASADKMFQWSKIVNDTSAANLKAQRDISNETRQAIKSKYESSDWLQKIAPIYDTIREKKRDGLVAYILEDSQRNQDEQIDYTSNGNTIKIPNPLYWKDANALFKYFLIDVEMCSCQITSRIKQAIGSVQLFVQRCFMNLELPDVQVTQGEKEDHTSPNAWSQWHKWMDSFVIWQANRKVFGYPENWLDESLRDDKTPFFEEFENEILQNEITDENVEAAYLNYLHKVHEVANLEVIGLYHEMEDALVEPDPNPNSSKFAVNLVHVIGRTKSVPHIYYYRMFDMNYMRWSAWGKIDVDITGDHVIPVIYNRKLHLFWLVINEKPIKVKKVPPATPSKSDTPQDSPEPMKQLEIQLAWSINRSSGWSAKKISKKKLIHPWERPLYSYNLKPHYDGVNNELYLDIYLSTSKEFNDGTFYDPYQSPNNGKTMVRITKTKFDETTRPWHSSSFLFNGELKSIELKPLTGYYHLNGSIVLSESTSYQFVAEDFGDDGKFIQPMSLIEAGPRLKLPTGMHFNFTGLTNNQNQSVNNTDVNVIQGNNPVAVLTQARNPFTVVISQQDMQLDTAGTDHPFFYEDNLRAFFIKPEWQARIDSTGIQHYDIRQYQFYPFYHPYTSMFLRELNRSGIEGIFKRSIQSNPQQYPPANNFQFSSYIDPHRLAPPASLELTDKSASDSSDDIVDFSYIGAYSVYNWEIFVHAPLTIACQLMQNQRFDEAMRWFQFIFNPYNLDDLPTPQRYWITKIFSNYNSDDYRKQSIDYILSNIDLQEYQGQLVQWRNNPFEPFVIARLRPVAFQKNIVMKFLDNLIKKGDQLFSRNTIESINASLLPYTLAADLLGSRPEKVPAVDHEDLTFEDLEADNLDDFGNAHVAAVIENSLLPIHIVPATDGAAPMPKLETMYYCIPNNDYLTKYWDTIDDRLYKIRHCMNIEGVVETLPLFDPPIDPALLVKAAAAGIDLNSVLDDLSAPTPYYRFRVVVQKAVDFCNDVKVLGEKLVAALEKRDAEDLAVLRSEYEIDLLEAIKEIKKKQIDELVQTIGSLNKAQEISQQKKDYYDNIPRMNDWETTGAILHGGAIISEIVATVLNTLSAGTHLIPDVSAGAAGFGGSPELHVTIGGGSIGSSTAQFAALFQGLSTILHSTGSMVETQGTYTRRDDENKQQSKLATIEIDQIQFQINAAQIRQDIAETDLDNQQLQIDNAKSVNDFMRNKYSNSQLYTWMISQISSVYFQAYQLAYQMAKKAEKCYQFELGIEDSSYVQFGYWDGLKKGLLAGDKLMNDLKRLETAYLDNNKRQLEITKHISLAQMFPAQFITLKQTGTCSLSLPEWLFDMDYPGHFRRRIKSVSISIPCVVGPYTGINCTLTLTKNTVRIVSDGKYGDELDPQSFSTQYSQITSIATSHGQQDNGMFVLDFNDERFLPFEGAGAISDWQIDLPIDNNYFDFASLADVILHIGFTAQDGGPTQQDGAKNNLLDVLPTAGARLFSLRHDFPSEWYQMFNPSGTSDDELIIVLKPEHFPFFLRSKINTLKITQMDLFVQPGDNNPDDTFVARYCFNKVGNVVKDTDYQPDTNIDNDPIFKVPDDKSSPGIPHITEDVTKFSKPPGNPLVEFRLKIKVDSNSIKDYKSLKPEQISDCFLLLQLGTGN